MDSNKQGWLLQGRQATRHMRESNFLNLVGVQFLPPWRHLGARICCVLHNLFLVFRHIFIYLILLCILGIYFWGEYRFHIRISSRVGHEVVKRESFCVTMIQRFIIFTTNTSVVAEFQGRNLFYLTYMIGICFQFLKLQI